MSDIRRFLRFVLISAVMFAFWLASEQSASAQGLLAQTGMAKTAIGWLLVVLAIGLGFLVVCRPSGRKIPE
jgi:hypothetical protein